MARKGDSVQAEGLLNMMIDDYQGGNESARPDHKLFDTVLSSCIGAGGTAAVDRAEAMLRRMWELSEESPKNGNLRPRDSTYKAVIVAHKKCGNAKRADDLLWELKARIGPPDRRLFQTVLNAWHESQDANRQYHIQKIRNEMARFGRGRR